MKISELIKNLEELKNIEGDISVCASTPHDYWGQIDSHIYGYDIIVRDNVQPDGPKSGKSERAVVFYVN